jgi:hypothetical protein
MVKSTSAHIGQGHFGRGFAEDQQKEVCKSVDKECFD